MSVWFRENNCDRSRVGEGILIVMIIKVTK